MPFNGGDGRMTECRTRHLNLSIFGVFSFSMVYILCYVEFCIFLVFPIFSLSVKRYTNNTSEMTYAVLGMA